jgi:hypothetical protein
MLHDLIAEHRDEIIRRCRAKVTGRAVPPPTDLEIEHGIPLFLDQLVDALRRGLSSSPEIGQTALLHGHELLRKGFTVSQVVHDYGDVCQSITELAVELKLPISTDDFRKLNGCLDVAIAGAVTQYGREREAEPEAATTDPAPGHGERLGFFALELRDLIQTAMIAFDVVKAGNVGVAGSTGAVIHRSLVGARDLVARSLAEVLNTPGLQNRQTFLVADFVKELAPAAIHEAHARSLHFTIVSSDEAITVNADRQVLATVVKNLLENAFTFTRPKTTVTLRVAATPNRVLLQIEDACGGLPPGDANALFLPFAKRRADQTGLGLGLAFSRWAVEANDGRIHAHDLPKVGCIFTIDLPRVQVPILVGA